MKIRGARKNARGSNGPRRAKADGSPWLAGQATWKIPLPGRSGLSIPPWFSWGKHQEDGAGGDVPPVAGGGAFGGGGEAVLVEADAEVGVGGEDGLAGSEEAGDGGGAGAEFFDEFGEPAGELASFGGEGGEPHLPVEPGLERGDLGREAVGWAGLVAEEKGLPVDAVDAVFEGEFRATDGHDGKKTVSGGKMPRGENSFPRVEDGYADAGEEPGSDGQHGKGKGKLQEGGEGAEMAPGNGDRKSVV